MRGVRWVLACMPLFDFGFLNTFRFRIYKAENESVNRTNPKSSNPLIGIPGKYTTANFLLGLAFPNATNKVELVFSDIENAVLEGRS